MDKKYWFFTKEFKLRGGGRSLHYEPGTFHGTFAELVLYIVSQNETDKYYDDFNLINWQMISKKDFDLLKDQF